jgi:uncharacterized membrane protein YbhN (UPF0104 family)
VLPASEAFQPPPPVGWRAAWPAVRNAGIGIFFVFVVALLVWQARRIAWGDVVDALHSYRAPTLLAAFALACVGHLIYSTYDLIGRHVVGHALPARKVMRIAFVAYAFNLSLGMLLGGVAMRVRQYARLGIRSVAIARIVALSLVTNWSGYLCLAGIAFSLDLVDLPDTWRFDGRALQIAGFVLVGLSVAYVVLCHAAGDRCWSVRGHEVTLPSAPVAAWQIAVSTANWATMAAIVWVLIRPLAPHPPSYGAVVVTLLLGAIAGVLAKVPGGLGVIEAVFVALLGHRVPEHGLLAALLTYRALYYLLPLATAALLTLGLEARARRDRPAATVRPPSPAVRRARVRRARGRAAQRTSG